MNVSNNMRDPTPSNTSFWRSKVGKVFLGFALIAGLLLVYEHRAHLVFGNVWLVIFFAFCIGMHLFMHGGRGHHSETRDRDEVDRK
jgi:hypothetical protein